MAVEIVHRPERRWETLSRPASKIIGLRIKTLHTRGLDPFVTPLMHLNGAHRDDVRRSKSFLRDPFYLI